MAAVTILNRMTALTPHVYGVLFCCRSEINLGADATGFTVVRYYRPSPEHTHLIRVRLYRARL